MKTIKGELEIDAERGVIYFHAAEGPRAGTSMLRICGLPRIGAGVNMNKATFIDVTVEDEQTQVGVTLESRGLLVSKDE